MPTADPPATPIQASTAALGDSNENNETNIIIDQGTLDQVTFDQIREMDDDEDDGFSRAIVGGFLEQAEETFDKMDEELNKKNLEGLSSLGHFLKGSSATLGLNRVRDYCEEIQHIGGKKDATELQEQEYLENIKIALGKMREEFKKVKVYFSKLYPE